MANKTIGQLTAKTTPASADVFALEDTEDTKKINYDALADAILNKITSKNYTVAGSSQTLINAINTLNSKTIPLVSGVGLWNGDIDTYKTTGIGWIQMPSSTGTSPGFEYFALLVFETGNSGIVAQMAIDLNGQSKTRIFANGNWRTWM